MGGGGGAQTKFREERGDPRPPSEINPSYAPGPRDRQIDRQTRTRGKIDFGMDMICYKTKLREKDVQKDRRDQRKISISGHLHFIRH